MEADIIKIGNSKGIRIPASLMKQCGIAKKVKIEVNGNAITLTPIRKPREGWEEAFKKAKALGQLDGELYFDDCLDNELLEEWKANDSSK